VLTSPRSAAESTLAALADIRASEDPQDKADVSIVETFTAFARRQPDNALRHARGTLTQAGAIGISADAVRWAWPVAARAAYELGDGDSVRDLVALLDSYQPGHLAPMLRAERDLARARLAGRDGDQAAAAAFAAAISGLRVVGTPYHLAQGLLDHAGYLARSGESEAAGRAIGEARTIASGLGCQPILDRAASLAPAKPRIQA
jgi:hypothetical protein